MSAADEQVDADMAELDGILEEWRDFKLRVIVPLLRVALALVLVAAVINDLVSRRG